MVIEAKNIVNMDSFDTAKISDIDCNVNSLNYSVSDSKNSADFKIDHKCPMEIGANVDNYTSCTINHESNI